MCLGIPGKIIHIEDKGDLQRTGKVAFGSVHKEANLSCVPDAQVGDYVIVHVGFAISKVDDSEAKKVFEYLEEMGELEIEKGDKG